MGYTFEVKQYGYNTATKTFTLLKNQDEKAIEVPSETLRPAVGDRYVLTDLIMPESYVTNAERELQQKAQAYLDENSRQRIIYSLTTDPIYFREQNVNIVLGTTIRAIDADFNLDDNLRVIRLTKDLQNPYNVQFEVAERAEIAYIVRDYFEAEKSKVAMVQADKFNAEMARRAYRFGQEISENVFDGEGYFNAEKIKPLSIETKLLSVGSRMQQFALPDVVISVENATTVSNTQGKIVHLTLEEHPREWQIPANTQTGITAGFNYIYIKTQRIGSNASVFVSPEKIAVDSDVAFYHFEAGYLGSVENGQRRVRMSHGFTQINPFEITTGRIAPPSGNHYIELTQDSINVVGNLRITDGNINQIKQSISPDLLSLENRLKAFSEQKVNDLQVGGRNLVRNSRINETSNVYGFGTRTVDLEVGKTYTFSVNGRCNNLPTGKYLTVFIYLPDWSWADQVDIYSTIDKTSSIVITPSVTATYNITSYYRDQLPPIVGDVTVNWYQVTEGNKPYYWRPNPEDLHNQLQAEQEARQTAIDEAKSATESYARAQADLAKTLAIAQADNNISEAEQRQIANATQKLQEAKTFAEQKVNELQISHRNHVLNSRITMNTPNVLLGGIKSLTKDPIYGDVVRYDRTFEGGGDFQFIFKTIDVTCLNNKDLIYMVIAKPLTDTGTFRFGIWSHTFNALDQNSSKKDLGNGWYCYWKKVNVPNVGGADIMGINSVYGSWLFYAVGIFEAKNYIDWQPNPQDIEKDLQHAKAWADMFNDAEKANVEKISKIFQKQDDFVNGTYQTHNTIATGAIMVGNVLGGNAGINGSGNNTTDVRFWAGANFANRANAPFRVLDNGEVHATNAHISGQINATSGNVGGFDISANGLRAGNFTTNGLALLDSGIIFRNDLENVFAGIGTNMFPSITGIKVLQRLSYEGNDSSAVGLYIKVRPTGEDYFGNAIKRALQLDGNFFQKGASAIFEEAWIGQAHNDIIKTKLSRTHTYCFSGSYPTLRHVYLPSRSEVQEITGATNVTFDLKISCLHNMSGTIRINGVADGYIRNTNGDIESGGNGYWNMGRGDSIVLRYCEGNYYIISYVR